MHPEHRLIMSNLIFLTISQLEVRHLEIIKRIYIKGRAMPGEIIEAISDEMKLQHSSLRGDFKKLSEMRIIYHARHSNEVVELTDIGRLIAEELMREV